MKAAFVFLLIWALRVTLHAHPVAQGSLELRIAGDAATAALRVSNEQIFVAGSLGEGASEAGSFDDLLTQHGRYLLRHFQVVADGAALSGEVREVQPPADRSVNGFTTYVLRYALPRPPAGIEVRQDLLTEILFAPGNPWEAPIVARAWQDDRPLTQGALLTAKQPLHLGLGSDVTAEFSVPASASAGLAWDFFRQGLLHISAGWDHALFVAALVLALPGFWRVLALVSAFTLAHTITLTVAALGWVHLRSSVVQPLIAASIVAAAAMNVFFPATPLLRSRLGVAFGFGLFHGLGFAGGLVAAMQGFAPSAVAAAIGGFSIGVELGHQVVVLPLLGLLAALRKWAPQAVTATVYWLGMAILAVGLWLLAVTL